MASASGDMASASGDMASASGDMASPSGDMASPSGDMASPSGDMASPSGAGEAIFQVISMNAGQKIKIKGGYKQRRNYVRGVIDKKNPDLVFLQEFPSPREFRKEMKEIPRTAGYQILSGVHKKSIYTTILYKDELEVKEYNNYKQKSFAERLYVGRCKKDGSLDLLVASYHGANTETGLTDEKKEENLCKLLTLLDGVSFNEGCPVLVGGDFNLTYEKANRVVQERNSTDQIQIKYNLYAAASKEKRENDMVDYFMYSGPVEDVSNVEIVDAGNELFDHKPLYANFKQSKLAPSPFAKKELFRQKNYSPLLDSKLFANSEKNYLRAENAKLQSTVEMLTEERDYLHKALLEVGKNRHPVVICCCADIHREKYGPFPEQKE